MPKLCICTVQIPQIGIIFVHHGGVMISGERLMWLFLYKYYGYIQMIIFDVEVDDYFCIVTDMSRQCRFLNLNDYFLC